MNLNEWLDGTISQDGTITLYDSTVSNFRLLVEKCETAGLIEFDSVDNRLNITYRRVATEPAPANAATGDSVYSIRPATRGIAGNYDVVNEADEQVMFRNLPKTKAQAQADEMNGKQDTPQADSDSGAAVYHYHIDSGNFHTHIRRGELPDSTSEIVVTFDDDDLADTYAETCVEAIEKETSLLRQQLAAATSERDNAYGEIKAMRAVIAELKTEAAANADTANDYKREAEHLKTVREQLQETIGRQDERIASMGKQLNAATSELESMKARVAGLAKYADGLAAENSAVGIVISSVGIKVNEARDLLFAEKYAAADSALKNAQVIIGVNSKDTED